jgi:arylsulfatase A-like enzyme
MNDHGSDVGAPSSSLIRTAVTKFENVLRALLTLVCSVWISDIIVVLAMHGMEAQTVHGLLVALGASYLVVLLVAAVATIIGSLLPDARGLTVDARLRSWFFDGDPHTRRDRATEAVTWLVLAGVFSGALYFGVREVLDRVVTDRYRALAVAVAAVLFAVITLLLRRQATRLVEFLLAPFRFIPFVRALLATPLRALVTTLTPFFLALVAYIAMGWNVFRALPWLLAGRLAGAVVAGIGILALTRIVSSLSKRARRIASGPVALFLVGCMVVAFLVQRDEYTVRRIASEDSLTGLAAYRSLRFAFDFDRDGYLAVLGDGDCKEFAPGVLPGSIDVPGNGIDENCDGEDASFTPLGAEAWSSTLPDGAPEDPTVVLITIDGASPYHLDVGTNAGGSTAEERADTPNIRAWADESLVFDDAFVQGPSTRLSFPSIFTSRWDSELPRVRNRGLPHNFECHDCRLATFARSAGYETVAVVSNVYFTRSRWSSVLEGFRVVDDRAVSAGSHNADKVTERAIAQLERDRDQPLFMWVHYYDAHSPFTPVEGDPVEASTPLELHHRELAFLDEHIQPLFEAIEAADPDALVIVTSDHGTVFRGPAARRRGYYGYDLDTAALHVPMVLHARWLPARHSSALVSSMDITPTILNALRVEENGDEIVLRGQSMFRHVSDQHPEGRMLFHQFFLPEKILRHQDALEQVSVRTERYNLVFNRKAARWEMYDWVADYFEQDNLLDGDPPPEQAPMHRALEGFVFAVYEPPEAE